LASGSDYADLAATLSQACAELVGHPVPDGRGGTVTMTKADCGSVREAVAATRMTANPVRASAPEARTCSKRTPVSYGFRDDFEPAGDGEPALYFDGGRVEYSRNGGPWTSAARLFDAGGYNAQITGYHSDKQAYTFRGFGGDSHGYRSSRLNLTSLAGSTVRF